MPDTIVYKTVDFKVNQTSLIKSEKENKDFFSFSGYASTFDVDLDGDQILPGSFVDSLKENMPALLWGHNSMQPAIGIIVSAEENSKGLFITAKMPTADTLVSGRIKPQMEIGSIDKMSIGFKLLEWKSFDEPQENGLDRQISKVELVEVSLVNFPANPAARVTALEKELKSLYGDLGVKNKFDQIEEKRATPWQSLPKSFADRNRRWDSRAATNRWRRSSGSSDSPSSTYRRNFLWFDAENTDNFGSYKLPIGDIVDGSHKAIPRAIFAARAVLAGARGGVNIPDSDRVGVRRNINRYYEAMELETPFKNEDLVGVWTKTEIMCLAKSDLSFVLRHGTLSRDAADYISGMTCSTQGDESTHDTKYEQDAEVSECINMVKNLIKNKQKKEVENA